MRMYACTHTHTCTITRAHTHHPLTHHPPGYTHSHTHTHTHTHKAAVTALVMCRGVANFACEHLYVRVAIVSALILFRGLLIAIRRLESKSQLLTILQRPDQKLAAHYVADYTGDANSDEVP